MNEQIKFTVNGKPVELNTDSERTLLWVLRTDLKNKIKNKKSFIFRILDQCLS